MTQVSQDSVREFPGKVREVMRLVEIRGLGQRRENKPKPRSPRLICRIYVRPFSSKWTAMPYLEEGVDACLEVLYIGPLGLQ